MSYNESALHCCTRHETVLEYVGRAHTQSDVYEAWEWLAIKIHIMAQQDNEFLYF